ncbi:hypothetical protein BD770DRAFT_377260 [Pilaira anomala]|nr:hypothetical protein BD770DRAFT_377260 [Pilaira anomala]
MSSVSSYEGSEKDSFFQRNFVDGQRHSYLRKTDLLDTLDATSRLRDTDTWSVAATIDDQESVISTHGGPPSIISSSRMTMDRETDDDHSTLDGETSIRDQLHDVHLHDNNSNRLETLRGYEPNSHLLRGGSIDEDQDDKQSRSNAAEFGDDGARSATGDFDHSSVASDDNVVDDQISAPPQPQPSFASVTKSYAQLLEENEILQSQLRNSQLAQKHQADMISNLRSLTGCDDELYDKALDLSHTSTESKDNSSKDNNKDINKKEENSGMLIDSEATQVPVVNSRTLTQKLARLAETLTRFVHAAVEEEWRLTLEQSLFLHITRFYLNSLPFGTENQHLLNTAYSDQIRRFHSTLGTNFAKWYRRQTVQSLSLNPATKEYLQDMRNNLTDEMMRLLNTMTRTQQDYMHIWNDILDLCAALSLEIHGGDADVTAQPIAVGSKFDQEIMAVVGETSTHKDKLVKMVISPLFVDEEEVVLLPARVVLG